MNYKIVVDPNQIDKTEWGNFVENHPKGNIFQTYEMYLSYLDNDEFEPQVIAIYKDDAIVGLQLSYIRVIYKKVLRSFTSHSVVRGGPLIQHDDPEILESLLEFYSKGIQNKALFSEYRNLWDWGSLKSVFQKKRIMFEDHLDIIFDLKKGEEDLWSEVSPKRRRGIRKIDKVDGDFMIKEIDLSNDQLMIESYAILKEVYDRIGLPLHDIDFFRSVKKFQKDRLYALGLLKDNKLIAVRYVLCYKSNIFDWYAGALGSYANVRPNDRLPWELLKFGQNNGYTVYDFGGAGKPNVPYGVRDFKLSFGGTLVNYGRFKIIHKPIIMGYVKKAFELKRKLKI